MTERGNPKAVTDRVFCSGSLAAVIAVASGLYAIGYWICCRRPAPSGEVS